jgi:hypothetical protein
MGALKYFASLELCQLSNADFGHIGWCISNLAPSGACCLPRLALSLLFVVCLDTLSSCDAATLPATAADYCTGAS